MLFFFVLLRVLSYPYPSSWTSCFPPLPGIGRSWTAKKGTNRGAFWISSSLISPSPLHFLWRWLCPPLWTSLFSFPFLFPLVAVRTFSIPPRFLVVASTWHQIHQPDHHGEDIRRKKTH